LDDALRAASLVACYVHPKLSSSNVTIQPSLWEAFQRAADEELRDFSEEADRAADRAEGLATAKPRGRA
jgi:hypothetical protein